MPNAGVSGNFQVKFPYSDTIHTYLWEIRVVSVYFITCLHTSERFHPKLGPYKGIKPNKTHYLKITPENHQISSK
jgi:hypothetical protein